MDMLPPPLELAHDLTERWIRQAVLNESLCPFAPEPWHQGRVRIEALTTKTLEGSAEEMAALCHSLLDDDATETALAVFPFALDDFEAFLDAADTLEAYAEAHAPELQLASFHPEYVFAETEWNAPSNFTNRAPLPTLQWLRAASVSAVSDLDLAAIPARNIARFDALEEDAREALRALPGTRISREPAAAAHQAETDVRVVFGAAGIASTRRFSAGTYIDPGPWKLHIKKGTLRSPAS